MSEDIGALMEGETPETTETPTEPQNGSSPTTDESGEIGAEEGDGAEAKADDPGDSRTVPLQALREERRKRQKAQEDLAFMRGKQEASQQQQQQPQSQQAADDERENAFWNGPRKYSEDYAQTVSSNQRLNQSVVMMQHMHDDYGEKEKTFIEATGPNGEKNPQLHNQMLSHPAPAMFAYEWAKQQTDVGKSPEDIRKEIEAEVRAEYAKKGKPAASPPQTLAGARGSGNNAAAASDSGDSLEAVLGNQSY